MKQGLVYSVLGGVMLLANWLIGRAFIPEAMALDGGGFDLGFVRGIAHPAMWDSAYFSGAIVPFLFYTLTFIAVFVLFAVAMRRLFSHIKQAKREQVSQG